MRYLLTALTLAVLLSVTSWHGAFAADPSLGGGSGKWVLVDTKVGRGWQKPCDAGRCKGSLLMWEVGKTSITYRNHQVDNGIDYSDATFVFTLPDPPAELYEGKESLVFSGTGSGYVKGGYWGTRLDVMEGGYLAAEMYIDAPDSQGVNPSSDTLNFELEVPPGSGAEFRFGVFLNAPGVDDCRACPAVEWVYRFKEEPVALGAPGRCSDLVDDPDALTVNEVLKLFGRPPTNATSKDVVARVVGVFRDVQVRRSGSDQWIPVVKNLLILRGDEIRTGAGGPGEGGRARVEFLDSRPKKNAGPSVVNIGRGTTFCVNHFLVQKLAWQSRREGFIELIRGTIRGQSTAWGETSGFTVRGGFAIVGIRGSDFLVSYEPGREALQAYLSEGDMEVINTRTGERKRLGPGHKVAIDHGSLGAVEQLSRGEWEAAVAEIEGAAAAVAGIEKGCSDMTGAWEQTSGNSGTSTWTVTGPPGGPYNAVEEGLGKAEGPAIYQGGRLKIVWKTGTWAGYYEWALGPDCAGGKGTLVFKEGTNRGKTDTSSVTRLR